MESNEKKVSPKYSVVVPVFESSESVIILVDRLNAVFSDLVREPYEIILIDDGSENPLTWKTLQHLAKNYPVVEAVRLMRNYGKAAAVLCGLSVIRGKWVITIDDDLQQRPEDIPKLIEKQDHDVVVAYFPIKKHSRLTLVTSWIKSKFDRVILKLPCKMSPLKLFNSEVANGMLKIQTARPFIPALMSHVTSDFVTVCLEHDTSQHGKSRYSFRRRLKQFLNLIIGNSSILLRIVGVFGSVAALSGFAYTLYIVFRKFTGGVADPGWTSIVAINLVFGGLTLIVLGIIGEYLIRILEGSSQKPPYIVRVKTDNSNI